MKRRINSFDVPTVQSAFERLSEGEVIGDAVDSPEAGSTLIHVAARLAFRHVNYDAQWAQDAAALASHLEHLAQPDNVTVAGYTERADAAVKILEGWEEKIHVDDNYLRGYLAAAIALIEGVANSQRR